MYNLFSIHVPKNIGSAVRARKKHFNLRYYLFIKFVLGRVREDVRSSRGEILYHST